MTSNNKLEKNHYHFDYYYNFCLRLPENPKCSNCDIRERDDDDWHTLFECSEFLQQQDEAITTLQEIGKVPLLPETWVPIMLHSEAGWDLEAEFVTSAIRSKMESAREQ